MITSDEESSANVWRISRDQGLEAHLELLYKDREPVRSSEVLQSPESSWEISWELDFGWLMTINKPVAPKLDDFFEILQTACVFYFCCDRRLSTFVLDMFPKPYASICWILSWQTRTKIWVPSLVMEDNVVEIAEFNIGEVDLI